MLKNLFNCFLILRLANIVLAGDDSSDFVETTEHRHVDVFGGRSHRHVITETEEKPPTGCPHHNIFAPCECNEVSFDGSTYQTQISCRGLSGREIQSAFHNAAHETQVHQVNSTFDILEIKDSPSLNICCDDLSKGFKFRTIKITDSTLTNINENSFASTSQFTKEFVLMDVQFANGLDDGRDLFNLVKRFENLEGVYVISSNLKELPQNAFITNGQFGNRLQIVRICNSLISKLYDLTFAHLNLLFIDLGDNKINQITANTFTMINANQEATLRISLSGNRLTSGSIEEGAFGDTKRSIDVYLNDNQIDTLKESVWYRLINSEKNVLIHLKNNPLICDCRHHWLSIHKQETDLHLKDANCEGTGQPVLLKNFALCEKAPILDPFGDVYKKCCRQIQYKNKPTPAHETVLIGEVEHHGHDVHHSDRIVETTFQSKTHHHDDLKQVQEVRQVVSNGAVKHADVVRTQRIEHYEPAVIKHTDIKQHVEVPIVRHSEVPVVKHVDVPAVKHVDIPVTKHIDVPATKHVDTVSTKHLDTVRHVDEVPIVRNEVVSNRLVALPQNVHRLLSPAVLVKKPLKYRRLVATTSNQASHPTHHVVYGESSVPHVQIVVESSKSSASRISASRSVKLSAYALQTAHGHRRFADSRNRNPC